MKRFTITVNGRAYDVQVEENNSAAGAVPAPAPIPVAAPVPVPAAAAPAPAPAQATSAVPEGAEVINSPMPGTILDVRVSVGSKIKKGDVLLILEAMKMENEILSPHDATVAAIHVNKGDSVETGKALVSLQ